MLAGLFNRIDDVRRLRLLLIVLLLALAIPTGAVLWQAYGQLKWESFHQVRGQAEALTVRINEMLADSIRTAESQEFSEYAFLNITGDPQAGFLQRSPLSAYPVDPLLPGLVGYFQVDADGRFSTPLLPANEASATSLGISIEEFQARRDLAARLQAILASNRLTSEADAVDKRDSQEYFDELKQAGRENAQLGSRIGNLDSVQEPAQNRAPVYQKVEELRLDDTLQKKSKVAEEESTSDSDQKDSFAISAAPPARERRVEQSALPEVLSADLERAEEPGDAPETPVPATSEVRITTFESEVDPFEFALLDGGEFVLFRNVWREGERLIQGLILDQDRFVDGAVIGPFLADRLSGVTDLAVVLGDFVIRTVAARGDSDYLSAQTGMEGDLLYRSRLVSPMSNVELVFSVDSLPAGPGGNILRWTSGLLVLVFGGGFIALYRLGLGQIRLVRQQQDFVASVSHELKTPLTSIRMYSEMLKEGWTDDGKKQQYYEFIHDESERLSRLISNVLQLASITRNEPQFDLRQHQAETLLDQVRSRIAKQVESAGFELQLEPWTQPGKGLIEVDEDCIMQIVINLVDNAIKFSRAGDEKKLVIGARLKSDSTVRFSVRDFGPGIPKDQIKKIFRLFYRPESELTRETVGTGIGLAIVHQLTLAMGGRVDVLNRNPGAEFGISFPVLEE